MSVPPGDAAVTEDVLGGTNEGFRTPPRGFGGVLASLGPGLIIAGAIVGSGELILTTKVGAQAGISLLWLILLGCLVKVFVQVELGRYAVSQGETTLVSLNRVPGPRLGVNWIMWLWLVMMVSTVGQLGGIIGGVGQSLALMIPLRGDYAAAVQTPGRDEFTRLIDLEQQGTETPALLALRRRINASGPLGEDVLDRLRRDPHDALRDTATGVPLLDPPTWDDRVWAGIAAVLTSVLLYFGRYGLIQNVAVVLVATFTAVTVGNVVALQTVPQFALSGRELLGGFLFRPPPATGGVNPWLTALMTFGIIGVGATELIAYPYWCLEKGYAKYAGQNDGSAAWATRAAGWVRVMTIDAFASMVVYTLATLAFFVLGATVLHRLGLDPGGMRMIATLAESYVPIFGSQAAWLFLAGAVAVLYSTYLIANASNARMIADGLRVAGIVRAATPTAYDRVVTAWSVGLPLACYAAFWTIGTNPVTLIAISGFCQAIMLPALAVAALWFRYTRTDRRLVPGPLWDVCLVVSSLALLIAASWGVWHALSNLLG